MAGLAIPETSSSSSEDLSTRIKDGLCDPEARPLGNRGITRFIYRRYSVISRRKIFLDDAARE